MIWRVALSALVMVFVAALLSELGYHAKRIFTSLCVTLLFISVIDGMGEIFKTVLGFAEGAGVSELAKCAVKVVGVGYVFGFVSDIAEELGEKGISTGVGMVGRVEIFVLVFPYFKEIINTAVDLLK